MMHRAEYEKKGLKSSCFLKRHTYLHAIDAAISSAIPDRINSNSYRDAWGVTLASKASFGLVTCKELFFEGEVSGWT